MPARTAAGPECNGGDTGARPRPVTMEAVRVHPASTSTRRRNPAARRRPGSGARIDVPPDACRHPYGRGGGIDAAGRVLPRVHRPRCGGTPRVHSVTLRATFFDATGEDRELDLAAGPPPKL